MSSKKNNSVPLFTMVFRERTRQRSNITFKVNPYSDLSTLTDVKINIYIFLLTFRKLYL